MINEKSFVIQPELETVNLLLRKLSIKDADKIFEIRSDKLIAKYLDRPVCGSKDEALEFIKKILDGYEKGDVYYWAVCLKEEKELAGTVCLWNILYEESKADIGFELLTSYQGRGIMQEAVDKVIDFAFNILKLKIINGEVDPMNTRSIKLMEKKGFTLKDTSVPPDKTKTVIYNIRRSG